MIYLHIRLQLLLQFWENLKFLCVKVFSQNSESWTFAVQSFLRSMSLYKAWKYPSRGVKKVLSLLLSVNSFQTRVQRHYPSNDLRSTAVAFVYKRVPVWSSGQQKSAEMWKAAVGRLVPSNPLPVSSRWSGPSRSGFYYHRNIAKALDHCGLFVFAVFHFGLDGEFPESYSEKFCSWRFDFWCF